MPVTLLTLFNLGFGQLTAQTTSVHSHRKLGNPGLHESSESDHRDALYGHMSADTQQFFQHSLHLILQPKHFFLHHLTCCTHWFDCPSQDCVVQCSVIPHIIPLNNYNRPSTVSLSFLHLTFKDYTPPMKFCSLVSLGPLSLQGPTTHRGSLNSGFYYFISG